MNHRLILVVVAGCCTFLGGCNKISTLLPSSATIAPSPTIAPFMTKSLPVTVTSPKDAADQFVKASDRYDKPMLYSLLTPAAQAKSGAIGLLYSTPMKLPPDFKLADSTVQEAALSPDGQAARVTAKLRSYNSPFARDAFVLVHNTPNGWRVSGIAYPMYGGTESVEDYENPKIITDKDIEQMRGESFHQIFGPH